MKYLTEKRYHKRLSILQGFLLNEIAKKDPESKKRINKAKAKLEAFKKKNTFLKWSDSNFMNKVEA